MVDLYLAIYHLFVQWLEERKKTEPEVTTGMTLTQANGAERLKTHLVWEEPDDAGQFVHKNTIQLR